MYSGSRQNSTAHSHRDTQNMQISFSLFLDLIFKDSHVMPHLFLAFFSSEMMGNYVGKMRKENKNVTS